LEGRAPDEDGSTQRLGFVAGQEADAARRGLLLQETEAEAGALDRVLVLAPFERAPGTALSEAPHMG